MDKDHIYRILNDKEYQEKAAQKRKELFEKYKNNETYKTVEGK